MAIAITRQRNSDEKSGEDACCESLDLEIAPLSLKFSGTKHFFFLIPKKNLFKNYNKFACNCQNSSRVHEVFARVHGS